MWRAPCLPEMFWRHLTSTPTTCTYRPGILALLGGVGTLAFPTQLEWWGAFSSSWGAVGKAGVMVLGEVSPHPHALHVGLSLLAWSPTPQLGRAPLLLVSGLHPTCPRPRCPIPPYQKARGLPWAMGTDVVSPRVVCQPPAPMSVLGQGPRASHMLVLHPVIF